MNPKMHRDLFLKAYDDFADAIFRHCYFRLSDRERAKDLMQETFTRVWQYLSQGSEVQNMKAFLYQIANNLIIDYYRKKKDLSLDNLEEQGFDPGYDDREHLENFIAGKQAIEVVNQLKEPYRGTLIMRYIDDLPIAEIAKLTQVSENLVSVRLNRALGKLREIYKNKENGQ